MKRTKILATLGPAVDDQARIHELLAAGTNGVRINLSHGNHEQWQRFIAMAREASQDIPVVVDTKGPELRILNITQPRELASGDTLTFSTQKHDELPYTSQEIHLESGQCILIDDGNITAEVVDVSDDAVTVTITNGGRISDRRKLTVPSTKDHLPILTEADKKDLRFCQEQGIDAVAVSFTRTKHDLEQVRKLVGDTMLIAKIENGEGVAHIDEIIDYADAVMVARGDLGVEMPLEEVPLIQKEIIKKCNRQATPVIVATQMLESMVQHNKPTRAEASDVANAILDGADCVMLSGETAMGDHPVQAVKTMAQIASKIDPQLSTSLSRVGNGTIGTAQAISNAVYDLSLNLKPEAIITSTASGFTARMVARFRPQTKIIGVAHDQETKRRLQLTWGVEPIVFLNEDHEAHKTIYESVRSAREQGLITEDCTIIATAGVDTMQQGSTNLIEVHDVQDLIAYHEQA